MSTSLLVEYCTRHGGMVLSIDNSTEHIARCSKMIGSPDHWCSALYDSAKGLGQRGVFNRPDLLYLDSFDYPVDPSKPTYAAEVIASQEHCLREVQAAAKSGVLSDQTVLLIDDCMEGGGKPGLAKQWLIDNGWTLVLELYQSVWIKL